MLMTEILTLLLVLSCLISIYTTAPLMLSISILISTAMVAGLSLMSISKWMACVVLLVFLGGMMVVFVYATSLTGNLKLLPPHLWPPLTLLLTTALTETSKLPNNSSTFTLLYSQFSLMLSTVLALALIMALILCTKMLDSFKGALIKPYL